MSNAFRSFTEKHGELWKFIKFTFTGVSTTALQMIVDAICLYWVFASLNGKPVDNAFLIWLGVGDQMAAAYSYFVAATVGYIASFIMNRKMTFKSDANAALSMVLYVVMVVVTILVTTWLKAWLYGIAASHGHDTPFINALLDIFVILVPFLWTYPLQRFVIHRPAASVPEEN